MSAIVAPCANTRANLIRRDVEEFGEVLVVDWGLCKVIDAPEESFDHWDAPSSTVLAGMASSRGVASPSASPAIGSAAFDSRVSLLLARPKPFAGSNNSGGWPLVALVDFRGA